MHGTQHQERKFMATGVLSKGVTTQPCAESHHWLLTSPSSLTTGSSSQRQYAWSVEQSPIMSAACQDRSRWQSRDRGGFCFTVHGGRGQVQVLCFALTPAGGYVRLHISSLAPSQVVAVSSSQQSSIFIDAAQFFSPSTFSFLFWMVATA